MILEEKTTAKVQIEWMKQTQETEMKDSMKDPMKP
jgi:hypothetical protein